MSFDTDPIPKRITGGMAGKAVHACLQHVGRLDATFTAVLDNEAGVHERAARQIFSELRWQWLPRSCEPTEVGTLTKSKRAQEHAQAVSKSMGIAVVATG